MREITGSGCWPRPGALPDGATVDIASQIRVRTNPENAEVNVCLEQFLQKRLPVGADVATQVKVKLTPHVTTHAVETALLDYGLRYVNSCYVAKNPSKLKLKATAQAGDEELTVDVEGASRQVATCVAGKLQPKLRELYSVPRTVGAKAERYFRADSDIAATLSFGVEPARP